MKSAITKVYHIQIHKIHKGKNHESNKGGKVPNLHGKTDRVHSRSVHTNLAGQKGVVGYIQYDEWENHAAKDTLASKAVIQNRRKIKSFPDK